MRSGTGAKKVPRSASDEARIEFIRSDRWINYELAQDAVDRLTDLLTYPPRDRMPCLLIYGATGMGKTKLIRKFLRQNPQKYDRATGVTTMPVVAFQMPASPDEDLFYNELHRALGGPDVRDSWQGRTKNRCRNLLHAAKTRMLVVDEIHSMLAGTARAQKIFLNTLRFLANDVRMPLVCAGTDEARLAILMDSQLAERFDAFELPRWRDDVQFGRLLASIGETLPLRKLTRFDTASCRKAILARTNGVTNRIFRLIETAAVQAIRDGSEAVTEELLSARTLELPLVSMTRKSALHAYAT
ncbi:MAG: transposase [Candidatus Melainabacteria bacterium]|nr:MAG: transposase [Candidatus Melainabacteria bacterium]